MEYKYDTWRAVFIWIIAIAIFLFIALKDNTTSAFPPQIEYEPIFRGRVNLHIYNSLNREYVNQSINTTFNYRVMISARVTIYSEAPVVSTLNRDIIVQFDELSEISRRYITRSSYLIIHSSYQLSENNTISPCICYNNYCMQCINNIGSECALDSLPNQFCFFDSSNKFSRRTTHVPGIVGFSTNGYYISFMY